MRGFDSQGILMCILFFVVGGMLGGILGDAIADVPQLRDFMPALSQHYEIINIQNVKINAYMLEFQFGIRFAPNILSILGILLALFIFRRVR